MNQKQLSSICHSLANLQESVFVGLENPTKLEGCLSKMQEVERCVTQLAIHQQLDQRMTSLAWTVASNIALLSSESLALNDLSDTAVHHMSERLESILSINTSGGKRSLPSTPLRSSKRQRGPSPSSPSSPSTPELPSTSRANSPTPSESPSLPNHPSVSTSLTTTSSTKTKKSKEADHSLIRTWFLQHLSKPYPTLSQKENLAKQAGITRAKVDSDLTNFRRRSGWTDVMNTFCGGDRDKMKRLIDRTQSGKEDRPEVLERVEGIKDYLGRREEERVGDWVREVTALTSSLTSNSTDDLTNSTEVSSGLIKHRSNASLSSLSTVSNIVRPTQRSSSGSSTISTSTSSSLSDASFVYLPISQTKLSNGNKRLNPNAEPFVPNKRYLPSTSSLSYRQTQQENDEDDDECRWVGIHPALPTYDPSMWSTTTSIPLLPHMSSSGGNTWSIPTNSTFQPSLAWSEGSVSGISRAL